MTEEEAREKECKREWKWHPDHQDYIECITMCSASKCMKWKWSDKNMGRRQDGEKVPVYGDCGLK